MKKEQPYMTIQILSPRPKLRGWTVTKIGGRGKPLALSFPKKEDADLVTDLVNKAYAEGQTTL